MTRHGQPEQQRHPGGVDRGPQRGDQRVGDRHQQRLLLARRCRAPGSWPGSRRRRRAASPTTSAGSGRPRAAPAASSRRRAGDVASREAPGPGHDPGDGRVRRTAGARGPEQQRRSPPPAGGPTARPRLQVEQLGGEQVDLGLDRAVAQPAQGEHDAERGGAEEEHHAGGGHDRRSQRRAGSRSAAPGPASRRGRPPPRPGAGRATPTRRRPTRITTAALKNTSPAMMATGVPSSPRNAERPGLADQLAERHADHDGRQHERRQQRRPQHRPARQAASR